MIGAMIILLAALLMKTPALDDKETAKRIE
jgi:hypothetical protein